MEERMWDFTTLDTFLTCRQKYYQRIIMHRVPITVAPALEFGKAIHIGLEALHDAINEGGTRLEALAHALHRFRVVYEDREGEDRRTVANGEKLLRGYEEVYRNEPFKITAQEIGFAIPVGEYMYCGRIDALAEWDGQLYAIERKTTSVLGSNYFKQFELSMQVDGYLYGASVLTGRKCMGVIIDALEVWKDVQKVTAKTKKLEDHYARDIQGRSSFEIEGFKRDVSKLITDILEAEKNDSFYKNKSSCFSYNYKCPYWDLCKYGENEQLLARNFKIEPWVPYRTGGSNGDAA